MRDLVAPGAVAFREPVQEQQDRRVARALINQIELYPVGERYASQPSASILSM